MKKIILMALVLAVVSVKDGFGQRKYLWAFNYSIGVPTGAFGDFIGETSTRGWTVEGRFFSTPNLTLGGFLGFYGFYENKSALTISNENAAATALNRRWVLTAPLLFTAHYYFGQPRGIRPYIGTGIGFYYTEEEIQFGQTTVRADSFWNFGFDPEVGVIIPFGRFSQWGAMANVKYNFIFYDEGLAVSDISFFNAAIGVYYGF